MLANSSEYCQLNWPVWCLCGHLWSERPTSKPEKPFGPPPASLGKLQLWITRSIDTLNVNAYFRNNSRVSWCCKWSKYLFFLEKEKFINFKWSKYLVGELTFFSSASEEIEAVREGTHRNIPLWRKWKNSR